MVNEKRPTLVTLTAPSCAGKSYLFNYIRDVMKMPCLISTTTRKPRANEVEGVDYFFISEEESIRLEKEDKLAELAIYRGVRYGVTKEEFFNKLNSDKKIAFLIVEPSGIDHYVKPALDAGANHFKVFIDVEDTIRFDRMKQRIYSDLSIGVMKDIEIYQNPSAKYDSSRTPTHESILSIAPHIDRLIAMATSESNWKNSHTWDLVLDGNTHPHTNLDKILHSVSLIKS